MAVTELMCAGSDITEKVLFETVHFDTQVNGVPGTCSFRVRDLEAGDNYIPGSELVLNIDGEPVWTGYVTVAKRVYIFPALNLTDFGIGRFWDIEGTDINILFTRRIVFDQSEPENTYGTLFPEETQDVDAIEELLDNWLDLSSDGLNTSSRIQNVGTINLDQEARAWSPSMTWGQAMASIAMLPAAIFYIDPDRFLVYADVEDEESPYTRLTDDPLEEGLLAFYSEYEFLINGSAIITDVMAWGLGYGRQRPVFTRIESTGQDTIGVWQEGVITFGVYKGATNRRIAESIINGSPESLRGAKEANYVLTLTTFYPGFRASQVVTVQNRFRGIDTLPIRKMEIDYLGPETPRYRLTLGTATDAPFSFFDPYVLRLPPLPTFYFPPLPLPNVDDCLDDFIDDFNRSVFSGPSFGTSSVGIDWEGENGINTPPNATVYVVAADGGTLSFPVITIAATSRFAKQFLPLPFAGPATVLYLFKYEQAFNPVNSTADFFRLQLRTTGAETGFIRTDGVLTTEPVGTWLYIETIDAGLVEVEITEPVAGDLYYLRQSWDIGNDWIGSKLWAEADPEPDDWTIESAFGGGDPAIDPTGIAVAWEHFDDYTTGGTKEVTIRSIQSCIPLVNPPAYGWVCEQFLTDGDTITLYQPFLPKSTTVFKAGYLQRQDAEYTEDPSAGTIEWASTPADDEPVRVCYYGVPPDG